MYKTLNQKGFTLVEILVVIVIIGIILSFLIPNLGGFTGKSNNGVIETDMRLIKSSLQEHYIDFPSDPLTESRIEGYLGYTVTLTSPTGQDPAYYTLDSKKDNWGNPYQLIVGNTPDTFIAIHSFGPNAVSDLVNGGIGTDIKDDILVLFYPKKN